MPRVTAASSRVTAGREGGGGHEDRDQTPRAQMRSQLAPRRAEPRRLASFERLVRSPEHRLRLRFLRRIAAWLGIVRPVALLTPVPLADAARLGREFGLEITSIEPLSAGSVNSNFA